MSLWQILKDSGYDPDVAPFPGLPSLTKGYNAALFTGATNEAKITNAIAKAVADGKTYVWIPQTMLPYNASLVTFNNAVKMLREGGSPFYYDIRAYGAAGTGAGDDGVAINAAITAASANPLANLGGSVVYVDAGTYRFTTQILIKSYITILGYHRFAILGPAVGAGVDAILGDSTGSPQALKRVTFDGLAVDPSTVTGSGCRDCISILACDDVRMRRLWVKSAGRRGITISNTPTNIVDCTSELNTDAGIYVTANNSGSPTHIVSCYIYGNGGDGIVCTASGNETMIQANEIIQNAGVGVNILTSQYVKVTGNTIVTSTLHGVQISSSHMNIVTSNTITQNGQHGVKVINADYNIVSDNELLDNSFLSAGTNDAINLNTCTGTRIIGNIIRNKDGAYQNWGVNTATVVGTAIGFNDFRSLVQAASIAISDSTSEVFGNTPGIGTAVTHNSLLVGSNLSAGGGLIAGIGTLTYGANITVSVAGASVFKCTVTNATAYTFNAPSGVPGAGFTEELEIHVINSSGGACAAPAFAAGAAGYVTLGATTAPANGKRRIHVFRFDQAANLWYESFRSTADL